MTCKTPKNRAFSGTISERVYFGQRVAVYCRVSTDDQTCGRQERDLCAFATRAGHEVASGAQNDRAERKKVMMLAQGRQIDAILVPELSRWGRSAQDLVQTNSASPDHRSKC